jgi:hypothetical protein
VLKQSLHKHTAVTPALPCVAIAYGPSRLSDSTAAGKKNAETPL